MDDPLEGLWSTLPGKLGRFAERAAAAAAAQIRISRLIIEKPGPPGFLDKPGSVFRSQFDSFCPRARDSKAPEAELALSSILHLQVTLSSASVSEPGSQGLWSPSSGVAGQS